MISVILCTWSLGIGLDILPWYFNPSLCVSVSFSCWHDFTPSRVFNPSLYHLSAVAEPHPYMEVNSYYMGSNQVL